MASKKHRKKILSFYKKQEEVVVPNQTTKISEPVSEELHKKPKEKWFNITKVKDKGLSPELIKIKERMKGENHFIIHLKKDVQGRLVGALVQVGNFNNRLEVYPEVDQIHFSFGENGSVKVRYVRIYSDFPPSVSDFLLNDIKKIEEVATAEESA